MRSIEINNLPRILFSHIYKAESYHNSFAKKKSFIEISYIFEGSLTVEASDQSFCATKGDVVCFLHDTPKLVSADEYHCHHTVGIKVDWSFSSDENAIILPKLIKVENNTASICRLIDDIIHNQIAYRSSTAKGAAKILELLCAIDQQNRKLQTTNQPSELLYTNKAKSYIEQNIHSPLTQSSIAEHLGISPEYLCSVFKKSEGMTVMRYVNTLKLENIKTLMDNANLKLYEAAAIYGYSDPNYVSRLYKQLFGYNISEKPKLHPEF